MPEHGPASTVTSALDLKADPTALRPGDEALAAPTAGATAPLPSTKRALAYVYAGHLLRIVYLLVLVPYYGRVLGPEEYGRVLTGMSIYMVVWLIAEGGMPPAGLRNVQGGRDPSVAGIEFGRQLSGRLWTGLIAALVGTVAVLASPILRERQVMGLLAVGAGLLAAFNLGWYFSATLRFRTSVGLELLGFALNLALILCLVHRPGDGEWVFVTLLASGAVCSVWAYLIALRQLRGANCPLRGGLGLVRESLALFLTRSVTLLMTQSSTYLLALHASAEQVGQFGAAERLVTAGISLLQPAQQVFLGSIAYRLGESGGEATAYRLMWHSLRLHAAFGILTGVGAWALAPRLVPLVMGTGFGESVGLLRAMAVLLPLAALTNFISGSVLTPLREDLANTKAICVGAAVLVGGTLLLAPRSGADGVALMRVIAQAVIAAAMLITILRLQVLRRIIQQRT